MPQVNKSDALFEASALEHAQRQLAPAPPKIALAGALEARLEIVQRRNSGDGLFGWSISDESGPRFSRGGYEFESEAIGALWAEVCGW